MPNFTNKINEAEKGRLQGKWSYLNQTHDNLCIGNAVIKLFTGAVDDDFVFLRIDYVLGLIPYTMVFFGRGASMDAAYFDCDEKCINHEKAVFTREGITPISEIMRDLGVNCEVEEIQS